MDDNNVKALKKNPIISKMINNDFLIIPLDKILVCNYGDYNEGDVSTIRLHIDILKGE